MTVLSGREIKQRLELSDVKKRLVIAPILEMDEQVRDDQGSADLRLGFQFGISGPSITGAIDEMDLKDDAALFSLWKKFYKIEYVPFGRKITIHPHQLILSTSLEYVRLPFDLMAYVVGRSTWGRLGLTVATAIGVQPSFAGCLVLELRNLGEAPISLYPGQTIAQLFFHTVPGMQTTGLGQYSGATEIFPGTLSSERTHKKIEFFKKRYAPD